MYYICSRADTSFERFYEEGHKHLPTTEDMFVGEYGAKGTASRDEFDAKSRAWYYAEVLKNARKAAGITQQQLANVRLYPVRYA